MTDLKATIVDDDDKSAVISVDDLIMRIGLLTVQLMEKDKLFSSVIGRMQELEKRNAELSSELNALKAFKNDYDVLASRFNSLQEELKRKEMEIAQLKTELAQKDTRIDELRQDMAKLQVLLEQKNKKK